MATILALSDPERKKALVRSGGAIVCALILIVVVLLQDRLDSEVQDKKSDLPVSTQTGNAASALSPAVTDMPATTLVETPTGERGADEKQADKTDASNDDAYGIKSEDSTVLSGEYYLLQFGVFSSLKNAEALQRELNHLGLKARIESRVVAGPYPDRGAAESARDAIQRSGRKESIVVAARGKK